MSTDKDPFAPVRTQLVSLERFLQNPQVDLIALAKAYAALASAMLDAIHATGQTSMRFEAVVKALDLRTPKSALRHFLDHQP